VTLRLKFDDSGVTKSRKPPDGSLNRKEARHRKNIVQPSTNRRDLKGVERISTEAFNSEERIEKTCGLAAKIRIEGGKERP